MTSDTEQERVYATLPMRIKAVAIDSLIVSLLLMALLQVLGLYFPKHSVLTAFAMFGMSLLFEPLLISSAGCTIGQYLMGIRVIRKENGTLCPFHLSIVRYIVKILLGLYSLVYMLFSSNRQGIHDYSAKTIVVISKRKLIKHPEVAIEQKEEGQIEKQYKYPSAIRRFAFFVIWYIIAFFSASIILGILYSIIIAIGTIVGLTSYEESENNLLFGIFIIIIWIIELFLFAAVAYWASKGYLPGAMRKKITQDEIEAEKEHAKLEEEQADIMEGLNEKEELSSKEQKQIEKENLKTVKANTFIFTLFGFIVGLIFSLILLKQIVEIIFITLIGSLIGYVFGYLYGESKRKSITKI